MNFLCAKRHASSLKIAAITQGVTALPSAHPDHTHSFTLYLRKTGENPFLVSCNDGASINLC